MEKKKKKIKVYRWWQVHDRNKYVIIFGGRPTSIRKLPDGYENLGTVKELENVLSKKKRDLDE